MYLVNTLRGVATAFEKNPLKLVKGSRSSSLLADFERIYSDYIPLPMIDGDECNVCRLISNDFYRCNNVSAF